MANIKDCPGFETFGADVKAARKAKHLTFLHKLRDRGKTDAVTVMGFLLTATIYHNNIRNG